MTRKVLLAAALIVGLFACKLEEDEATKIRVTGLSSHEGKYATVTLNDIINNRTVAAIGYPLVRIPSSGTVEISMVDESRKTWSGTGAYYVVLLIYPDSYTSVVSEKPSWGGVISQPSMIKSVNTFAFSAFTRGLSLIDVGALAGKALKNIAQPE